MNMCACKTILSTVFLVCFLSACQSIKNPLIGKWTEKTYKKETVEFTKSQIFFNGNQDLIMKYKVVKDSLNYFKLNIKVEKSNNEGVFLITLLNDSTINVSMPSNTQFRSNTYIRNR